MKIEENLPHVTNSISGTFDGWALLKNRVMCAQRYYSGFPHGACKFSYSICWFCMYSCLLTAVAALNTGSWEFPSRGNKNSQLISQHFSRLFHKTYLN